MRGHSEGTHEGHRVGTMAPCFGFVKPPPSNTDAFAMVTLALPALDCVVLHFVFFGTSHMMAAHS